MNSGTLKQLGIWVGAAAVLGLMVWGLALLGASQTPAGGGGSLQDPITAADHAEGNTLSQNTLVEYSDFQCPACALYYSIVKQIAAASGGQLLIVYRYFPLATIHPNGDISARAAEAAARQGKFWEMHDLLFERQKNWTSSPDPTDIFIGYAAELGLDKDRFIADLNAAEVAARVRADLESGARAGVNETPTFYLNGKKLARLQTYGDLERAVKDTLK